MKIPDGFSQVTPYIFAEGALAYMGFLGEAFGAVEVGRTLAPDGTLANGQVKIGDAAFMLSEASERFPASRASFYLYVDEADLAYERALGAGAKGVMEISDMPYGDRQGGVRDSAGNVWWISQRLVDSPYY